MDANILEEALQRIEQERQAKTGFLDLGGLPPELLPDELFELTHLKALNLGHYYPFSFINSHEKGFKQANKITNTNKASNWHALNRLAALPQLTHLSLDSLAIDSLECLAGLSTLTSLNCSKTKIDTLEHIQHLSALTQLYCSFTQINSLEHIQHLYALTELNCSGTQINSLEHIQHLYALTELHCLGTQINSLEHIQHLSALTHLYCSDTQINSLEHIQHLSALTHLNCSYTQINSLEHIQHLCALTKLHCSGTQINSLEHIQHLSALTELHCSGTQINSLEHIQHLCALTELHCSGTQINSLEHIQHLSALTELNCSGTQINSLEHIQHLCALTELHCSGTQINSLEHIQHLCALTELNCSGTQINSLEHIQHLYALTELNCSGTQINSLEHIQHLSALTHLYCSDTQINSLEHIQHLSALTHLNCSYTQINSLEHIQHLSALTKLHCSGTQINSLEHIQHLCALTELNCSETQINSLEHIEHLSALTELDCSDTQINSLEYIQHLSALTELNCSGTQINSLEHIQHLSNVTSLYCSRNTISDLGPALRLNNAGYKRITATNCGIQQLPVDQDTYKNIHLSLAGSRVATIPREVLNQNPWGDCAPALAAHFADCQNQQTQLTTHKLMILGNGRVGKTQLRRNLHKQPFDETITSTHGIDVNTFALNPGDGDDNHHLQTWDFGGQDIYLGTHSLFMQSRAIFCLCWTPHLETGAETGPQGQQFERRPLNYWLDFIQQTAGDDVPIIALQTQCDNHTQEQALNANAAEKLSTFAFNKQLHFCAKPLDGTPTKNNAIKDKPARGKAQLLETINEAVQYLEHEFGPVIIGHNRIKVMDALRELKLKDEERPVKKRQHRTISMPHFTQICDDCGGVASVEQLAMYLHNAGVVFYKKDIFDDHLVLDQAWALDAIYSVFNREVCVTPLRSLGGKFNRALLHSLIWRDYTQEEQDLFLSMMVSCGIAFKLNEHHRSDNAEYIAPDFLPDADRCQHTIDQYWDDSIDSVIAEYKTEFMQPNVLRNIISDIGADSGYNAQYWKTGLCFMDRKTRSVARIDETKGKHGAGAITVRTQGGANTQLLNTVVERVQRLMQQAGTKSEFQGDHEGESLKTEPEPGRVDKHKHDLSTDSNAPKEPDIIYTRAGPSVQCAVSYAWGDSTEEGIKRERAVRDTCDQAAQQGLHILRDKDTMILGDNIEQFMNQLSASDRVFVFLTDKYLKSPFCMYELLKVWEYQRQNPDEFLKTVRVFTHDCAKIWKMKDYLQYALYWKEQKKSIDDIITEAGGDWAILGEVGLRKYQLMNKFSHHISDILEAITSVVQSTGFDEFIKYGFDDLLT